MLLSVEPSLAQTPTESEFVGTIRTPLGDPVQRAAVTLHDLAGREVRFLEGGLDGRFIMRGVGMGRYDVRVEALGFRPQVITGVTLRPGATTRLLIVLELFSDYVLEPWLYGSSTGLSSIAIIAGAVFGAIGVAAGAFGAHALASRLTPERLITFETGVRYQMYHALALILVGWFAVQWPTWHFTASGIAFLIGITVFSGSLYLLVLTDTPWLGAITPIGGVAFITGWILLAIGAWRTMG